MTYLLSHEQLLSTLHKLFDELFCDFSIVPGALVSACCDVYAIELDSYINRYFDHGIIDPDFIGRNDVKRTFAKSQVLHDLSNDDRYTFIDDLEEEMGWLFCKDDDDDMIALPSANLMTAAMFYLFMKRSKSVAMSLVRAIAGRNIKSVVFQYLCCNDNFDYGRFIANWESCRC